MEKAILDKHTFSHSVLTVEMYVQNMYAEVGVLIDHVDFYELEGDEYTLIEEDRNDPNSNVVRLQENTYNEEEGQHPIRYIVNCAQTQNGYNSNHLVKACIYVKKTDGVPTMCCGVSKGDFFYFERWFVDLTQYQKALVGSINLRCNDCNVPMGTINKMLKMFAVQAAVESQDPMLEYIYSKIACGTKTAQVHQHINRECNCNG